MPIKAEGGSHHMKIRRLEMEWQKPQIKSYSEEELVKELLVKAFSGQDDAPRGGFGSLDGLGVVPRGWTDWILPSSIN